MSVNLKVKVVEGNDVTTRTYRLPASASIHECMQQIRERMPDGGKDHLLFRPTSDSDPRGIWLKPNKTLESYDINSNDLLWFRKKHHLVKVKLADESVKTVLVDLTANLRDLVMMIAAKIHLNKCEEYALQFEGQNTWLKTAAPITEQGNADDTLVLKKRLYINDSEVDKTDAVQLHLVYVQNKEAILSGMHVTTKDEAALFGALSSLIECGMYNASQHKSGYTKMDKIVPPPWCGKPKDIEPAVIAQWKGLGSMKQQDAKHKYLQLCMTLRTYGITMFNVTANVAPRGSKKQMAAMRLGVAFSGVMRMTPDGRTVIKQSPLEQLRKWSFTDVDVTLDYGDFEDELFVAQTQQGAEISSLIAAYVEIMVRRRDQKEPDPEDAASAVQTQNIAIARGVAAAGTTSSTVGGAQPGQMGVEEVRDLESARRLILNLQGPIGKQRGISAEVVKSALKPEQLAKQLASHAEHVGQMVPRMIDAARAGDVATMSDISRQLALATQALVQTGMAAASMCTDPLQQSRLLDAAKQLTDKLADYLKCVQGIKSDAELAELKGEERAAAEAENAKRIAEAQRALLAVEMALAAVTGAASGGHVDPNTESLVNELARNVQASAKDFCRGALQDSQNAPPVVAACKDVVTSSQDLVDSVALLAPVIADPNAQAKVGERIKALRNQMAGVVTAMAQCGKSIAGVTSQMKITDTCVRQMLNFMENPKIDMDPKKLAFLRSANVALNETSRINAQRGLCEATSQAGEVLKQEMPTLVVRAKALAVGDEEARDRMLQWARQVALGTKKLIQMTGAEGAAATVPFDRVRETAQHVHGAVLGLIGDDEYTAHRVALIDNAKAAAATVMRVAIAARDMADKRPGLREKLLDAAAEATDAVMRLMAAVKQASGSEGDERVNTNALAEAAEAFCPQVVKDLIVPIKQATAQLDASDPLRNETGAACQHAARDVQRLLEETRAFKEQAKLADLGIASEGFRAAEARFQALVYASDSGNNLPLQFKEGTTNRDEAVALVPDALSGIPAALDEVDRAAQVGESAALGVRELSASSHMTVTALRALVAHSRFKREKMRLLNAGKELMKHMNGLLDSLTRIAKNPEDDLAQKECVDSSAGICRAMQEISRATMADEGSMDDDGNVAQSDAALEKAAAESLQRTQTEVQRSLNLVGEADNTAKANAEAMSDDPKAQVAVAVLDSVQALVATTAAVVSAAHGAQVELCKALSAPATRAMYAREPEMAQGLIDASDQVAQAVRELTGGLNPESVDTLSQQELVSHAEAVSKSCEALAAACRAGTRAGAGASGLLDAARAVSDATRALVEAAKMIDDIPEVDAMDDIENFGIDAFTLREIKQQMKIVELEKQLAVARRRMDRLQKSKVKEAKWQNV